MVLASKKVGQYHLFIHSEAIAWALNKKARTLHTPWLGAKPSLPQLANFPN